MRRKDREVKDINEIEAILKNCKTCHVAMIDGNSPYVVPMSYGYELTGGVLTLYFHSATEGRKINAIKANNKVCFAVSYEGEMIMSDIPCECSIHYAGIIGNGEAFVIDDTDEKRKALSKMFARQTGKNIPFSADETKGVCLIKIVSKDFTAKRL